MHFNYDLNLRVQRSFESSVRINHDLNLIMQLMFHISDAKQKRIHSRWKQRFIPGQTEHKQHDTKSISISWEDPISRYYLVIFEEFIFTLN